VKNCLLHRVSNVVGLFDIPNQGADTMSEFTYLYRGGRDTPQSPEQRQKQLQKWAAWFKELGANGHLKELGHPLESAGMVVKGNQKMVTDGPYAEAKDLVGGFSLIEASDLAHAVEISKGCPVLEVGGSVEVRPVMQLNM
jgi:hypothetical protein